VYGGRSGEYSIETVTSFTHQQGTMTMATTATNSVSNKVSQLHLDKLNSVILKVNDATAHAIENLQEGEKISLKALTERVARFLGLSQALCAPFVMMFVKSYDRCTMQKGRNGGIYKGKMARKEDMVPRCNHCGQKIRAKRESGQLAAKPAKLTQLAAKPAKLTQKAA